MRYLMNLCTFPFFPAFMPERAKSKDARSDSRTTDYWIRNSVVCCYERQYSLKTQHSVALNRALYFESGSTLLQLEIDWLARSVDSKCSCFLFVSITEGVLLKPENQELVNCTVNVPCYQFRFCPAFWRRVIIAFTSPVSSDRLLRKPGNLQLRKYVYRIL